MFKPEIDQDPTQMNINEQAKKIMSRTPGQSELSAIVSVTFGGVCACSPELYRSALERIAKTCGRECDDAFRREVREILDSMPCALD